MARPPDPEMRPRILDAADRLLARHGFRRMTVEALATEAAIGKGSVYLHFESKEDVALSCIDRMAARVVERLEAIASGRAPVVQRLREMLRVRVLDRFDYARRHAPSIDQKLAVMRQSMLERRAVHFAREAAVLARVVEAGRRDGSLAARDPSSAGMALVIATNALLPYSLSVRELGRRDALAGQTDAVIDLLLAGLVAHGPSPVESRPNPRRNP